MTSPPERDNMKKYTVSSNIGASFRCGLNHVVLDHGVELYKAEDVEALLEASLLPRQYRNTIHAGVIDDLLDRLRKGRG